MPTPLFQALLRADQIDLPTIEANIDTALAVHNMKERLKEVHRVVAHLVRYTILQNAEKEGVDLANLGPIATPQANVAQVPIQHFPSAGNITLGPPQAVISPSVSNVIVGSDALPGMSANLAAPEPEASDVIEVVIGRSGTKVIPPRGSGLAPQTFAAGQIVDAAKIVGAGQNPAGQG